MKKFILFIGFIFILQAIFASSIYAQPDLIVRISRAPSIVGPGNTITITSLVANQGTSTATNCKVSFYLSDNNIITSYDILLLDLYNIGTLTEGSAATITTSLPIFATKTGTWYLGAIVDTRNTIVESNENNNTSSLLITINYDDNYEENDTISTSSIMRSGNYIGLKCYDVDWYKIYLSENDNLTTTISFTNSDGNLDMDIYGTDGTTLLFTSNSTTNIESVVISTVSVSGYYYIKVYGYEGATNSYDMRINLNTIKGSISGLITRIFDTLFVPDATVEAIPKGTTTVTGIAQSNQAGMYSIQGLPAGTYTIRASKIGCGTQTIQNILVRPDTDTPKVNLVFIIPSIITPEIITNMSTTTVTISGPGFPKDANLILTKYGQPSIIGTDTTFINDSTTAMTTFNLTGVQSGTWSLILRLANNIKYTITDNFIIYPPIGSISISSSPQGAKIYLDNIDTGLTTPATLTRVQIGTRTIQLTMDKYIPVQDTYTVEFQKTTIVNLILKRSVWDVYISAAGGNYTDQDNFAGLRVTALDGYDSFDIPEPPPLPSDPYLSLYFPHPEWGTNSGNYTTDYHYAEDLSYNRKIWDFEIATRDIENTDITISFSFLPSDNNLFLIHGTNTIDLQTTSSYTYNNGTNTLQRFKLVIGGVHILYQTYTSNWNMVSFPMIPVMPNPSDIFYDDIPEEELKLYHWTGTGYDIFNLHSPEDFGSITIGSGYWLKFNTSTLISIIGNYVDPAKDYTIHIKSGWNQIGMPFNDNINWSSVKVAYENQIVDIITSNSNEWLKWGLYQWEGTGYLFNSEGNGQLSPYLGYWVNSKVECDLIIPHTANTFAPSPKLLKSVSFPSNWYVKVSVQGGGYNDKNNIFGVGDSYSDGYDSFDTEEPPYFVSEPYLSLYSYQQDYRLTYDYRQPIGTANKTWEFEICANKLANTDIRITWPVISGVPDNYNLYLVDIDGGNQIIDMRINNTYTYQAGTNTIRHFRFIVGHEYLPSIKVSLGSNSNTITVSGSGFKPTENIVIIFGNFSITTDCDLGGNFITSFNVPQVSSTTEVTITAKGSYSRYQPIEIFQINPVEIGTTSLTSTPNIQTGFQDIYAYPNPFYPQEGLVMNFTGLSGQYIIQIFNIAGELVRTLDNKSQWDGKNENFEMVASGIYIYLITMDNGKKIGKLAVIR